MKRIPGKSLMNDVFIRLNQLEGHLLGRYPYKQTPLSEIAKHLRAIADHIDEHNQGHKEPVVRPDTHADTPPAPMPTGSDKPCHP